MSGEIDKSQHVLPLDQPVVYLESSAAFKGLTHLEQAYSYHMSKACWVGGLITFIQTSAEAPELFVLLHKLFSKISPEQLKEKALKAGIAEKDVTALFVYTAGVFANAGNYKGFGDTKFIPNIDEPQLSALLALAPNWSELEPIWNNIKSTVYDLSNGRHCLGYPPHGCNTYLSKNCSPEDNEKVQKWMKSKQMEGYISRLFKTEENGKVKYEIRLASESTGVVQTEEVDNVIYEVTKGDYSPLMGKMAESLNKAIAFAANETQKKMLASYVKSFKEGSLEEHKTASTFWVQDKSPAVENYIGFIETYRDPAGVRGESEGFVAAVNREMSEKFTNLVNNAEKFLPMLPWGKSLEKDKFLRPDFTSLDVLTFAGSGIPAGINIPNYDEIRQSIGFKNVSLGNVIPASYQQTQIPFLSETDMELMKKHRIVSFEVQVGLHELLGHGSGKLLIKEKDGSCNFDSDIINPLDGKPITKFYEEGDTYDSIFGPLGSPFEECRAEAVGLYLSLVPSIVKIFGHEGPEAEDIIYVNWLNLVWAGLSSLEMWDPKRGWLQAHSQARFGIMRVLLEAGVVTVTQPTEKDLLITLDRSKLYHAGREAIARFLVELQVCKSTADIEKAKQLFSHYTDVIEPWKSWREIVLANKKPRKIFAQPNIVSEGDKFIQKNYEASPEGLIVSWVERFPEPQPFYDALLEISKQDAKHF